MDLTSHAKRRRVSLVRIETCKSGSYADCRNSTANDFIVAIPPTAQLPPHTNPTTTMAPSTSEDAPPAQETAPAQEPNDEPWNDESKHKFQQ